MNICCGNSIKYNKQGDNWSCDMCGKGLTKDELQKYYSKFFQMRD